MSNSELITLQRALELLGDAPGTDELSRLVQYYPTYERPHRKGLIKGFFSGQGPSEMASDKIDALNLPSAVSKQSKGGHTKWAMAKSHRLVIRLLYLRYRLDEGKSKRQANQLLLQKIWSTSAKDGGQSNIRKATKSSKLDQ